MKQLCKKYRKWSLFLVITVLVMSCFSIKHVEAASQKSKAIKAYKQFLSKSSITWTEDYTDVPSSDCKFALVYIDKDSVPELVLKCDGVSHAEGYYRLYTYKNGKVKELAWLKDSFSYFKKKGVFRTTYGPMMGEQSFEYYKMSKSSYSYVGGWIKSWWVNGEWRENGPYEYHYYKAMNKVEDCNSARTKEISKKQFQKELKKLVKSTKESKAKLYSNTAKNRKKHLK